MILYIIFFVFISNCIISFLKGSFYIIMLEILDLLTFINNNMLIYMCEV